MLNLGPDFSVHALMAAYGLWALSGFIFLESTGLPLPGETALVTAALYAGATHHFSLFDVIAVAFVAAVAGDTMGYVIGRTIGLRTLCRYGKYIHLTEDRLKIGEYLFLRHGGKIVFFGRFVALLRVAAALLAGANRMPWPRFAVMNALGGLCWASLFASAAYFFGDKVRQVEGPLALGMLALVAVLAVAGFLFFHRYEGELQARALAAMRDP